MHTAMRIYGPFAAVMLILTSSFSAQRAGVNPDTTWVSVVFYDFHADGSNPEFNPNHSSNGVFPGMVADTLSPDRKPVLGDSPFFSYFVHQWFRPWTPGNYAVPLYTSLTGAYGGTQRAKHDTSFKNIVIHDSLPFLHLGNSLYRFERSGTDGTPEFFWLDGKGFGSEPSGSQHNYSFTMELHTKFAYQPGLVFEFLGDDDVWVFVDGKLVMDLGGIHLSAAGSVKLDSLGSTLGLVAGKIYDLDFFYAERHTVNSCIKITTNMITRIDSIGPFITRATLLPGATLSDNDTVRVVFSEPISCQQILAAKPENIFVYIDNAVASSEVLRDAQFAGTCTQTYITEALIAVPRGRFGSALTLDSIGFVPGTPQVTDMSGNRPRAEKGRVAINLAPSSSVDITVNPSPVRIGAELDAKVRQAYSSVVGDNKFGAIVGIYSKTPLQPMSVGGVSAFGRADIYDATANIVQEKLPVKSTGRDGAYGIYWDVKNRHGRFVGNGTYLAMVTTTDAAGRESVRRVKIGVRR